MSEEANRGTPDYPIKDNYGSTKKPTEGQRHYFKCQLQVAGNAINCHNDH